MSIRKQKKIAKALQAMSHTDQVKTIQASSVEGVQFDVALDSMLDGRPINDIEGLSNTYTSYAAQVSATYKKYSGGAAFGNDQVRTIIDGRVAFIAGEGQSRTYGKEVTKGHRELFKKITEKNKLNSTMLFNLVKRTEMSGYAIVQVKASNENREFIPYVGIRSDKSGLKYVKPIYTDETFKLDIKGFNEIVKGAEETKINLLNAIYIRTGGYDDCESGPTTRTGIILTECENYDRALKDLRNMNYRCARITPDFQTKNAQEAKQVSEMLKGARWKIGQARVGTAEFSYKSPTTAADDMLIKEMTANLKTMSGTSGIPVHWFGWVDQMSNRATAQELYAMINNATVMEREAIEDAIKELYIKLQEVYINAGGSLIKEVTEDFEVKLPLIDFGSFKDVISAYSQLYSDDIISEDTYRAAVPGIDPEVEKKLILERDEKELAEAVKRSEFEEPEEPEEDEESEEEDPLKNKDIKEKK